MKEILELLPENERKLCIANQIMAMMDKDNLTAEEGVKRYFEIMKLTL